MRRLIFSLICSSGNAANVLKPTNVGIPSSQIRILYPAHSERFGLLRTLADSASLSLIKTARSNPMELRPARPERFSPYRPPALPALFGCCVQISQHVAGD